ncbi:MAG: PqqD family protein [Clostridia bacterium]|nr:PqqD family protein [Clostridia bacterium]
MKCGLPSCSQVMLKIGDYNFEISPHGRGMLFNKQTGEVLTLNVTGAFIASMLQKPVGISVIVKDFARQFELSEKVAEEDVLGFLEELREMNLLHEDGSI